MKFKNVDLELRVRPKVTPDNRVMLSVQVQKDDVVDLTQENPPLSTNQANTELLLEDGETIVTDRTIGRLHFQIGAGVGINITERIGVEIAGKYNSHVLEASVPYNMTGLEYGLALNWRL